MKTKNVEKPGLKEQGAKELCEAIMKGKLLNLPASVAQAIEESKFRVEARDNARLQWALVDGWTEPKLRQGKWKTINDNNFKNLGGSNTTKSNVKMWLIDNRFVSLKMETLPDGRVVPHKRLNREAQKYRVPLGVAREARVNVSLECKDKSIGVLFNNETGDDLYCRVTRDTLNLLELQEDHLLHFCLNSTTKTIENESKEHENKRINRRFRAISALHQNCGSVTRGTNVHRLYSPWAIAPKEIRPLFRFCGTDWVEFDLQASQPTLIADYCGDESFLQACYSDELYFQIVELLSLRELVQTDEQARKLAKKKFLAYCYGPIRKPNTRNKDALAIQRFVDDTYPVAADFVRSKKKGDYRTFNRMLQNREAVIFLDSIFSELIRCDIPVLTVHDCVYCRDIDAQLVEETMESILSQKLRKHKLKKETNNNKQQSTNWIGSGTAGEDVLTHLAV